MLPNKINWELIIAIFLLRLFFTVVRFRCRHRPDEIQSLQKATSKDFIYNGSFQEAVAPLLIVAECFAIMPVIGVKSASASKMYFTWMSVRTIYSVIVFVLMAMLSVLTVCVTLEKDVEFDSVGEWVAVADKHAAKRCASTIH